MEEDIARVAIRDEEAVVLEGIEELQGTSNSQRVFLRERRLLTRGGLLFCKVVIIGIIFILRSCLRIENEKGGVSAEDRF